jgi:hypothetical protein
MGDCGCEACYGIDAFDCGEGCEACVTDAAKMSAASAESGLASAGKTRDWRRAESELEPHLFLHLWINCADTRVCVELLTEIRAVVSFGVRLRESHRFGTCHRVI